MRQSNPEEHKNELIRGPQFCLFFFIPHNRDKNSAQSVSELICFLKSCFKDSESYSERENNKSLTSVRAGTETVSHLTPFFASVPDLKFTPDSEVASLEGKKKKSTKQHHHPPKNPKTHRKTLWILQVAQKQQCWKFNYDFPLQSVIVQEEGVVLKYILIQQCKSPYLNIFCKVPLFHEAISWQGKRKFFFLVMYFHATLGNLRCFEDQASYANEFYPFSYSY